MSPSGHLSGTLQTSTITGTIIWAATTRSTRTTHVCDIRAGGRAYEAEHYTTSLVPICQFMQGSQMS